MDPLSLMFIVIGIIAGIVTLLIKLSERQPKKTTNA